jgi:hypothetical protein
MGLMKQAVYYYPSVWHSYLAPSTFPETGKVFLGLAAWMKLKNGNEAQEFFPWFRREYSGLREAKGCTQINVLVDEYELIRYPLTIKDRQLVNSFPWLREGGFSSVATEDGRV